MILTIFKEIFSERNIIVVSVTTTLYQAFNQLWQTWWTLYLVAIDTPIPIIGLLAMIQDFSRIAFQFPGGILADRFGRKKVVLIGTAMRVVGPLLMFLGRTWQQVLPGMIVNSIAQFYMPAFNSLIAESLPDNRRGAAFGAYRTITSIPQIFMPALSGIYMDQVGTVEGVRLGLLLYVFASSFVFLVRLIFLKETFVRHDSEKQVERKTSRAILNDLSNLQKLLRGSKTLLCMVIVSCLGGFAMRMVYPFLAIYAVDVINLEKTQWGLLQSIFALIATPLYMFGGMLSDRVGRIPCIILARAISPIEYMGLLLIQNFTGLVPLFIILGIGGGLGGGGIRGGGYMGGPSWQALLADLVPSENRAKVFGLLATLTGLISMPSSLIGGYIWEGINPNTLLLSSLIIGASTIPLMVLYMKEPSRASNRNR